MSTMNPKSFARLMKLLDLAAVDIAQALYVSPSHVSRWKTGSRELKTSRSYFEQLEELFLSVNAQHADGRLERFLLPEPADRPPEEREARIANDTIFDGRLYDAGKRFFHNHTRGIGIALILVGLYSVLARIFSPLFYILEERYGSFWGYYLQEMVPTLVVALLVILLGVRLIRGKSTPKDDKDFKDYKGEDIDD